VCVLSTVPRAALRGDAAVHAGAATALGIESRVLADEADRTAFARRLALADLVVDALLGTGAGGAPTGWIRAAIEELERLHALAPRPRILALDVPSGLNAATGERPGVCVRADRTATFGAWKRGFLAAGARAFLGRVEVVDLGVPSRLLDRIRAERGPAGARGSDGLTRG
jgi:NAD(P)H-hydrate epimerase